MSETKKLRVVLVEPGKKARITEIDGTLEGMQKIVGGYIECVHPFSDGTVLVCNEEGKLMNLPWNRKVVYEGTEPQYDDVIAGTFFLCSYENYSLVSLSESQAMKYAQKFELPEVIFSARNHVIAVPACEEFSADNETEMPPVKSKTLLEAIRPLQDAGVQFPCPRCGARMRRNLIENALSRYADVYVCSDCGMSEAINDITGCKLPIEEWSWVKVCSKHFRIVKE